MKRLSLAALMLAVIGAIAFAANVTLTPIVPPNETGEDSLRSQQVVNMARLKLGMGTVTIAISGSAGAGTLNFASGTITLTAATAGASGATPSVVTLTNNKVQAADIVQCSVDQTGATAGSVLVCNAHVTANTITFTIYDATPTALTSSTVLINYELITNGNPN
jgi:hypothetical protein